MLLLFYNDYQLVSSACAHKLWITADILSVNEAITTTHASNYAA